MLKAIKILTIVSLLGLVSCGENSETTDSKSITSSFLSDNVGNYNASSSLNTCPGNSGADGDSCDESFILEAKGKFSRVYMREVGVNGSLTLPLGTLCKWTERGTIYNVSEFNEKNKTVPEGIKHAVYAMVDEVVQEQNNPVACKNFFNSNFLPYSLKMYSTITSSSIAFHTYGESKNNSAGNSAQSEQNLFVRVTPVSDPAFTF